MYFKYIAYTTVQKFGVRIIFRERNYFYSARMR